MAGNSFKSRQAADGLQITGKAPAASLRLGGLIAHREPQVEPPAPAVLPTAELLRKPLDELGLWTRTTRVLREAGILTIGDIVKLGKSGLLRLKGFGPKSLFEVMGILASMNLRKKTVGDVIGEELCRSRRRDILERHLKDALPMRQIGAAHGLSGARIGAIHKTALGRIMQGIRCSCEPATKEEFGTYGWLFSGMGLKTLEAVRKAQKAKNAPSLPPAWVRRSPATLEDLIEKSGEQIKEVLVAYENGLHAREIAEKLGMGTGVRVNIILWRIAKRISVCLPLMKTQVSIEGFEGHKRLFARLGYFTLEDVHKAQEGAYVLTFRKLIGTLPERLQQIIELSEKGLPQRDIERQIGAKPGSNIVACRLHYCRKRLKLKLRKCGLVDEETFESYARFFRSVGLGTLEELRGFQKAAPPPSAAGAF